MKPSYSPSLFPSQRKDEIVMSQKRLHNEPFALSREEESEQCTTTMKVESAKETLKRTAAGMLLSLRTQEPAESTCEGAKKRKLNCSMPKRRVSFSDAKSIVEVEPLPEEEKRNSWYAHEDYSQFVVSAHRDAQVLKSAAECATSAESLFHFIKSNPDLSPRGLEKVMHHGAEGDNRNKPEDSASSMSSYSRRIRLLKAQHREVLLSMHRDQKQSGQHNPEELRKFSESSSQWAVQTALKLGHIDAHGLI